MSLFKGGILQTANCTNQALDQQWVITGKG
jgi:hypothetical protein